MSVENWIRLGEAARKSKDFDGAIPHYRNALDMEPSNAMALWGLADACRGVNRIRESVDLLVRLLELRPEDGRAHTRLADAYKRIGQRDDAVTHYRRAIALDPRNRYALMGLGDLYHKEHRQEETLACWEALLALDPTLVTIQTQVGNIHRKRLAFEKAIPYFQAALAREPHNRFATFGLADSLRGLGRFAEAAPVWEEMLELDTGNVQVLTRAGDCFLRLGQVEKAERLFTRAVHSGYDKPALLGLARICRVRGEAPKALDFYRRVLEHGPGDVRILQLMAETFRELEGAESERP